jgi:hypothetical protein
MPTYIVDEPTRQLLLFRHRPPWCWLRLQELHLVSSGQRPASFQVLHSSIRDEHASLAYENALGSFMAMQAALQRYQSLDALMNQMADFMESHGIDGLEAPLLSGMFGLEGLGIREKYRHTSTLDRLAQLLRNSGLPMPIAGGLTTISVVDSVGGRISFFTSDGISQMLADLDPWLSGGVDAGMGGVGGLGYGDSGPVFNSFKTRLGELSAETDASGGFCSGFGAGASNLLLSAGYTYVHMSLAPVPSNVFWPLFWSGALGEVGDVLVSEQRSFIEFFTQSCLDWVSSDPDEEPAAPDEEEDAGTMPNPNPEETGLTPTDIQIARAVARLNAAKRVNPEEQKIFVGVEPVIVSSPGVKRKTIINPGYDPILTLGPGTPLDDIWVVPRPGGPVLGRSASLVRANEASVQVAEDSVALTFNRVRAGQYVPEARPLPTIPTGRPNRPD